MKRCLPEHLDLYENFTNLFIEWQTNELYRPGPRKYSDTDALTLNYIASEEKAEAGRRRYELWQYKRDRFRDKTERNLNSANSEFTYYRHYGTDRSVLKQLGKDVAALLKPGATMEALASVFSRCSNSLLGKVKVPALLELAEQYAKLGGKAWKAVPWENQPWFDDNPLRWAHMVHISEDDPTMVAYNQSVDKVVRKIRTRTKPGRYLRQFYPNLSEEQIRTWVHKFEAMNKQAELEYIENTNPDAWIEAYSHDVSASSSGYSSCMTGKRAVRAYAYPGNDLVLIVIRDENDIVIARTIGNKVKMEFVRTYTNRHQISYEAFENLLEKEGWTQNSRCLRGQRLQRIEHHSNQFVCPYLDGEYQYVEDEGDCLLISSDGMSATETCGYIDRNDNRVTCDHCGCACDEDETSSVQDGNYSVCESCLEEDYVSAYARYNYRDYYLRSDCIQVGDTWYHEDHLDRHDIVECDWSNDYYHESDTTILACGSRVADEYLDRANVITHLDVTSESEQSDYCYKRDARQLSNGDMCYEDDYDDLQAELDAEADEESVPVLRTTDHTNQIPLELAA